MPPDAAPANPAPLAGAPARRPPPDYAPYADAYACACAARSQHCALCPSHCLVLVLALLVVATAAA